MRNRSPVQHWGFWPVAAVAALLVLLMRFTVPRGGARPGGNAVPARTAVVSAGSASAATDATPASPVAAQVRPVFSFVRPPNATELDAALPAPAREIFYVTVDRELIAGKQSPFWQAPGAGRVGIPLPHGRSLTVAIENSEMLGPDRFTSEGRIEGRPNSRAIFAYNEGFLHASIEGADLGTFALRAATQDVSQFYQIDPTRLAPCGGERRPVITEATLAAAASRQAAHARLAAGENVPVASGTAAAENPQRPEVHVMMVYTQAVLPTLTGANRVAALQSAFDAAIAKVNAAFSASLITARVKLVKIVETNYSADGPAGGFVRNLQDDALSALQGGADGVLDGKMDELHAIRDQAGADLVCLALNRRDSASIGLSFVLETPGENYNALFAFSVVEYDSIAGTNVVPHELGHGFGCAHDRANSSGPGAYSYSYGYRFTGADGRQYHDIMAYPPGTELSYFSTPKIIAPPPVNAPVGIAAGLPGEADAARTIEQDAFEVANFRLQTVAAANKGTLVNVATRAFVGTGEEVLIGGFVIYGSEPKRVLVRGVGPALVDYGVTNPLGDPVIQLFGPDGEIAQNDNWSAQVAAGDVQAAAAQAGAFPFPAGSSDAALVATLPPGPYSAIVSGARGTTGAGMVEVYEVGAGGSKIINLSTRGYADRQGKEMYGGFVVQGAAGTTKRILVRVLGPTLGRAPFNMSSVMEDPCMEIYNEANDLIIQNDDWSTGSDGGINEDNDFRPVVDLYNEKQIFATGFAPSNRREPCVMLDLPPGDYSAIVKPFEILDPDPNIAQPARPGVAIVEVYEIDP
jgi:hypothetical protein